jgi:hypothetical protein
VLAIWLPRVVKTLLKQGGGDRSFDALDTLYGMWPATAWDDIDWPDGASASGWP